MLALVPDIPNRSGLATLHVPFLFFPTQWQQQRPDNTYIRKLAPFSVNKRERKRKILTLAITLPAFARSITPPTPCLLAALLSVIREKDKSNLSMRAVIS